MSTWSGHNHARQRQSGDKNARQPADEDTVTTPSQAEGDRETVEEALNEGQQGRPDTGHAGQGDVVHTPSQAEGDRETIERDLAEKGQD